MRTALALLQGMAAGAEQPGLALGAGLAPSGFLAGQVDLDSVAIGGHSYGGATAVAMAATDSRLKACVTLDPWWCAPAHYEASDSIWHCLLFCCIVKGIWHSTAWRGSDLLMSCSKVGVEDYHTSARMVETLIVDRSLTRRCMGFGKSCMSQQFVPLYVQEPNTQCRGDHYQFCAYSAMSMISSRLEPLSCRLFACARPAGRAGQRCWCRAVLPGPRPTRPAITPAGSQEPRVLAMGC